ncbi:MAG: TlpA family protein disulfide reductase [Acidimicrobiia bacterium]
MASPKIDTSRSVRTRFRHNPGLLVRLAALTIVAGSLGLTVIFGSRFGQDPTFIASPLIGKSAPDFTLPYLADTGHFTLGELRGNVAVVNFWASWCVPCRAEHADLVATADAFTDRGVRFVGVLYQDDPEPAINFLDELGWGDNYDYVTDPGSRAAIALGVFGVPETFFINPEGVIMGKIVGQASAVLLGTTLDQILRGEQPGEHTAGTVQSGPGG